MNPFTTPDNIYLSTRPQDMRAGVNKLSEVIAFELDDDPADGSLYVFVSRDASKCKMLRFDGNGWILYYCTMCEGVFKWKTSASTSTDLVLCIERRQLYWLLDGLDLEQSNASKPVTAHILH